MIDQPVDTELLFRLFLDKIARACINIDHNALPSAFLFIFGI